MKKTLNLLLATESHEIRSMIEKCLTELEETNGFNPTKITTANDGTIATLKVSNQDFDLFVIDQDIKRRNAISLVEDIFKKDEFGSKKVLIVCTTLDQNKLIDFKNKGIVHLVVKPYDLKKIVSHLTVIARG